MSDEVGSSMEQATLFNNSNNKSHVFWGHGVVYWDEIGLDRRIYRS